MASRDRSPLRRAADEHLLRVTQEYTEIMSTAKAKYEQAASLDDRQEDGHAGVVPESKMIRNALIQKSLVVVEVDKLLVRARTRHGPGCGPNRHPVASPASHRRHPSAGCPGNCFACQSTLIT